MKKLFTLFLFAVIGFTAVAQDSFTFAGIEIHNAKKWSWTPRRTRWGINVTGQKVVPSYPAPKVYNFYIQKMHDPQVSDLGQYLQEEIGMLQESSMLGTTILKVESVEEMHHTSIAGQPAMYADVFYAKIMGMRFRHRIYVVKIGEDLFTLTCEARGAKESDGWFKHFEDLIGSFYYVPQQ